MHEAVGFALRAANIDARRIDTGTAPLSLWLIATDRAPDPHHHALLSDVERARADRYRRPAHRDRHVLAHAALRLAIEAVCDIPARMQRFGKGGRGKPALAGANLAFNLSYSGRHVLIGLSEKAAIGVDIETLRAIDDAPGFAQDHYARGERAALAMLPLASDAYDRKFLEVWTRKEACLKALGLGLGDVPLASFACGGSRTETVRVNYRQLRTDTTLISSCVISWAWEPVDCRSGSSGDRHVAVSVGIE